VTALIAAEQLLCCVCETVIQIGEPVVYCDDEPVHELCEDEWWEAA